MKIVQTAVRHSRRLETLRHLSSGEISSILGFEPEIDREPGKVAYQWEFSADGVPCVIWSYRGSQWWGSWSAFGPRDTLIALFGVDHVETEQ